MKKRMLSLVLCVVLCLALLPRTVFAAEQYDIWVSGVEINSYNKSDVLGDGKVSFDPSTQTLTILAGANITKTYSGALIYSDKYDYELKINAPQGLTLNNPAVDYGISVRGGGAKLKITGDTSISTNSRCIYAYGNVVINGNVTLNSTYSDGINTSGGITIDGSLNVKAGSNGIWASNNVSISKDVTIQCDEGGYYCIYSSFGTVSVQAGVWKLDGRNTISANSITMPNHEVTEPAGGRVLDQYGRADIVDAYGYTSNHVVISPKNEAGHICYGASFADMPKYTNWAHKGIDYVISRGLMGGTSATTFEPKTPMSRAMLVTVLYRMEGQPGAGKTTFTDVIPGKWFSDAVSWAADNDIVTGTGGGQFNPNGNVTREQLAAILFRYSNFKGYDTDATADYTAFPDGAKVHSWAAPGVQWAVAEGLLTGSVIDGKTYLNPLGEATREQVAAILMRFCENVAR